jgi:hypothetical protein
MTTSLGVTNATFLHSPIGLPGPHPFESPIVTLLASKPVVLP